MWQSNLRFLRQRQNITQQELGSKLGIKGSRIRDYELGLAEPKLDLLVELVRYFNISLDELLTTDLTHPVKIVNKHPAMEQQARILVISDDGQGGENIVHVPAKARAGYLTGFEDPGFIDQLPTYRLPGVRNGTYRSFEITGDSMLPLQPGTIVVGQYVESWRDIKNNHTYILVTKEDGIVYKRVINRVKSKGQLVLLSDNPSYEPYVIPIEEVSEAWSYYCHLSNAGAQQKSNLEQLLNAVEDLRSEVAELKK